MKNFISLTVIFCFQCLGAIAGQKADRPPAHKEVVVAIEDGNKTQYLEQNFHSNAYEFGYEVGPNGQFHHENRGPDGVTYGCYGYIDPLGRLQATHYVADGMGYRTVEPGKPVEIFSNKDELEQARIKYEKEVAAEQLLKQGRKGHIAAWKELYFPKSCGMFPGGVRPDVPASGSSQPPATHVPRPPGSGPSAGPGGSGGSNGGGGQGGTGGQGGFGPGDGQGY